MSLILDGSQLEFMTELVSGEADRLDHEAQAHEGWRHGHPESLRERAVHARITLAALQREIEARAGTARDPDTPR